MKKQNILYTAAFCIVVVCASVAQAVITNPADMLWEGVNNITDGERIWYNVSGDYTWTLNEDALGNPADVTYSGSDGLCLLSYYYATAVTANLTIQTTVGAPGVLNYIGRPGPDSPLGIRIGHLNDTGIINIESGVTLLVHNMYAHDECPTANAVININDGHVFCYGDVLYKNMSNTTVNITPNGSLRIIADYATVNDPASYTTHTQDELGQGSVVYPEPGSVLVFADGGDYEGNPTVLITAVVPEPATLMLLSLGGLALLRNRKR